MNKHHTRHDSGADYPMHPRRSTEHEEIIREAEERYLREKEEGGQKYHNES
jgi:hypothetical protein